MYLSFKTTMTRAGAQRRAEAFTGAPSAEWTSVSLGDADSNGQGPRTYFPPIDEYGYTTQTQLIHPVWDGEIDNLSVGEDGSSIVLTFVVPKESGPFFFTEIGVRDENGNLLFIGTAAEAQYKPRLIPVNDGAAVFSFTISMTGDSTLKIKGEKGDQGDQGEKGDTGARGLRGFAGYGNAWLKTFDEAEIDDVTRLSGESGIMTQSVNGVVGSCMRIDPAPVSFNGQSNRGFAIRVPAETSSFLRGQTTRFQLFARKEESTSSRFAFCARSGAEQSEWQYRTLTDEFEPYYFDWDVPTDPTQDLEIVVVGGVDGDGVFSCYDLVAASLVNPIVDDEDSAHFEATITRKLMELDIHVHDDVAQKLEWIERRVEATDLYFIERDRQLELIKSDLDGEHNVGGDFNFGINRDLKFWKQVSVDEIEREAMIWRSTGQSGVTMMRQYTFAGDASHFRPSAVSFSALGAHDHPNYPLMSGMPELQASINGFPIYTRHTDYRWLQADDGEYLDNRSADDPPVPPEVTNAGTVEQQTEVMKEYYRALSTFDDARFPSMRENTELHVAYLEMWFEEVNDSRLVDAVHSFRHQFDSDSVTDMHSRMVAYAMTGLKNVSENGSFMPRLIQLPGDRGEPRYAITRYRVMTKRLGDLNEWPIDKMVTIHDDPVARLRSNMRGEAFTKNRMARFRVLHDFEDFDVKARINSKSILDRVMEEIPGLEGPSADIPDVYIDGGQTTYVTRHKDTSQLLNAARYNRWYSHPRGAAGRADTQRGFNDPTLYVARTNRPEVAYFEHRGHKHRVSYAIPLELVVTAPHMSWNPYEFQEMDSRAAVTAGGYTGTTPESALNGIYRDFYWNLTPDALYSNAATNPDPADTRTGAWIRGSDGIPHLVRSSGVYIFMPPIDDCGTVRLRYPIAPVHHEGSFVHGYASAVREEIGELQTNMVRDMLEFKDWARSESKILHDLKSDREELTSSVYRLINSIRGDVSTIKDDMITATELDAALTAAFDQHEAEEHNESGV